MEVILLRDVAMHSIVYMFGMPNGKAPRIWHFFAQGFPGEDGVLEDGVLVVSSLGKSGFLY